MLIENIWEEYWLVRRDGKAEFGPFTEVKAAHEHVVAEQLCDYELKTFLSYIPF